MLNNIKEIIEKAYEARGERMICKNSDVTMNGNEVTVNLDSENPYLGVDFFRLIKEIVDEMSKLGYSKKDGKFYMNYYTIRFIHSKK